MKESEFIDIPEIVPFPPQIKSRMGKWLYQLHKIVVSMEVLSPKNPDISATVKKVNALKGQVSSVNIPDGPRASARMGMFTAAFLLKNRCGMETITHYSCRDRNILGIQSDLLAMHALGLRNILAVTGDPPAMGNYPDVTAVFDVDSIGLVKILANLNAGLDISGKSMGGKTSFLIGVGVDPAAANLSWELERLNRKIEAGAEFIMTQPVYDAAVYKMFYERVKSYHIPVIMGISPLLSHRAAQVQNNEIQGMQVPAAILHKLQRFKSRNEAREYGIRISVELLAKLQGRYEGVYFMGNGSRQRKASLEIIKSAALLETV